MKLTPFLEHIGVTIKEDLETSHPAGIISGDRLKVSSPVFRNEYEKAHAISAMNQGIMEIIEADSGSQVIEKDSLIEKSDVPDVDRATPLRFNDIGCYIEAYIRTGDTWAINPDWESALFSVCYPKGNCGLVHHVGPLIPSKDEYGNDLYIREIRRQKATKANKLPCWYRRRDK